MTQEKTNTWEGAIQHRLQEAAEEQQNRVICKHEESSENKHKKDEPQKKKRKFLKINLAFKIIKIIKNNARAVCTCTSASARATSTLSPKRPPTPRERSSNT